jgi:YfiH family protein
VIKQACESVRMTTTNTCPFSTSHGRLEIRFLGKNAPTDRMAALNAQYHRQLQLAYLHQIHSSKVLEAFPGCCGKADALWTTRRELALSVVTADCVPVVIADQDRLAVAHAGWRGIVSGIVERTVQALGDPSGLSAWIGPAIGPCCYEVDWDVARQVAAASNESIISEGPQVRPHVSIPSAVESQLETLGISTVRTTSACTRCQSNELWSYRTCGPGAGRNLTFAWLADHDEESVSDRSPSSSGG